MKSSVRRVASTVSQVLSELWPAKLRRRRQRSSHSEAQTDWAASSTWLGSTVFSTRWSVLREACETSAPYWRIMYRHASESPLAHRRTRSLSASDRDASRTDIT
jgi:hypothetical protein